MIERLGVPSTPKASRPAEQKEKVQEAARQFEALLIGQMLKSMRASGDDGALSWGGDEAGSAAMEYAQEMFAQSLSAGGGLGMAKLVAKGLVAPPKD